MLAGQTAHTGLLRHTSHVCHSSVAAASLHLQIQSLAYSYQDTHKFLGENNVDSPMDIMPACEYSYNECMCRTSHKQEGNTHNRSEEQFPPLFPLRLFRHKHHIQHAGIQCVQPVKLLILVYLVIIRLQYHEVINIMLSTVQHGN